MGLGNNPNCIHVVPGETNISTEWIENEMLYSKATVVRVEGYLHQGLTNIWGKAEPWW